jgi:DNA-binding winged helix-turn-helix (wHTH) protein
VPYPTFQARTIARLQIGEWWADRTTNELGRAGVTVRIEPKAMEVLMVLADHAGQVVSREELLAAVWPGVVVGEEALTQSIIKLRRAFDDNPRSPSYIETIPKRGYRIIAPVTKSEGVPATLDRAAPALPSQPPASARTRTRWLGALAGVALALIVAGGYFVRSTQQTTDADADADAFDAGDGRRASLLTVTVMPFDTLGAGAEQRYLARGISSDLMTDLSQLSGLRLISASDAPSARNQRRASATSSRARFSATARVFGSTSA